MARVRAERHFCGRCVLAWPLLPEPLFLLPWWTPQVEALCMAAVAGVMLYIVFDELLPEAEAYGRHGFVMGGLVAGLAVMSLCLTLIGHGH